MTQSARIVWLSANVMGQELLKEAVKIPGADVVSVITLAEGSKTVMYDGVPTESWDAFGIPVQRIDRVNNEKEVLRSLQPDFVVMCGWRQIVDLDVLTIPSQGFIGFHPTLLPKGRGPAPIINTILEGIRESGITMYYVNEGVDTGDIIGQERFSITDDDRAIDVHDKIIVAAREVIKRHLPQLVAGAAPRISQNEEDATLFPKRTLADNEILRTDPPETRQRKIRAFNKPYRGAFIMQDGEKVTIWSKEDLPEDF